MSKYVTYYESYVHLKKRVAILSDQNCAGSRPYLRSSNPIGAIFFFEILQYAHHSNPNFTHNSDFIFQNPMYEINGSRNHHIFIARKKLNCSASYYHLHTYVF